MEGKEIIDKIIVGRVEPYIYAFTTNTVPNYLKIGDTYRPVTVRLNEWKKYFPDLKEEYKEKALVTSDVFFRDFAVHKYIEEELGRVRLKEEVLSKGIYYSNEFFENATDMDIKKAIDDIKESHKNNDNKYQFYDAKTNLPEVFQFKREEKVWIPRPNQQEAINNFINAKNSGRKNLLMYAVMRFGKSFTSMMCAKEMKAQLVVILSAKADVKFEWKKTVEQPKNFEGYYFISADALERNNNEISERLAKGEKVTVFLTLQDLQGDLIKEKHNDIFRKRIDLLIVDETHFGARAEKYGKILENTKYEKDAKDKYKKENDTITDLNKNLKILDVDMTIHLSGTPYRILMGSEFEKEDIISFCQFSDIVKEQSKWDDENLLNDETKEWDNPYFGFPQMIRFAFNPSKKAKEKLKEYKTNGYTYAFSALLKPVSIKKSSEGLHKKFINEQEILELFEVIDGSKEDENVLSFLDYEKIKAGKMCRHIVCVLPYCASCDALENLIISNRDKFKNLKEYEIINISGVENSNQYKSVSEVKDKIKECERNNKKTLTLTVNRMLTGSTVEEWDTMIYLKDTVSPQEYDQSIFRLQNQYIKKYIGKNGETIQYNMKPQTLLVDFEPYRLFSLQEQKSKIYNVNVEEAGNSLLEERLKNELKISPIIVVNSNKIVEITPNDIMEFVSNYSKNKGVMDETIEIPVDFTLLNYSEIKSIIEKQAELRSKQGLFIDNVDEEDGQDIETPLVDNLNNINEDKNENNEPEGEENKTEDDNSIEKRFRTYYARILFYAFLTKDVVISLSEIVDTINKNEDNKRIAKNLGLSNNVLQLMNEKMNLFILSQLDYKIQNINNLSKDKSIPPIERANIAVNKFKKISESEVVTPNRICKEMISLIPDERLKNMCESQNNFLDIASKMGELSLAIYEILVHKLNISHEKVKNIIYSIPTSEVAYELTREIYEILDLNTDNIAMLFNSYDLVKISNNGDGMDYNICKKFLLQNKKFSDIELEENIFFSEGEGKMKFDIIVGNPPYQEESKSNSSSNGQKPRKNIFQYFQEQAMFLSQEKTVLIFPGIRWIHQSGKGLKSFGYNLINNLNLEKIVFYPNAKEIFNDTDIPDGISIVVTDKNKKDKGFKYEYVESGKCIALNQENPGEDLLVINPYDISIAKKIKEFVNKNNLECLHNSVLSRSLFGIESDFIQKNNRLVRDYSEDDTIDYNREIKIFTNDKAGPSGRTRWFVADNGVIEQNREFISEWQVVVSSAHPGGQEGRDNQITIIDNHSAFGRARVALKSFKTKKEAENFVMYVKSNFIKYAFLLTDEALSSLAKCVPDINNYRNKNDLIDFSKPIDEQLYKLIKLNVDEIKYIESKIK